MKTKMLVSVCLLLGFWLVSCAQATPETPEPTKRPVNTTTFTSQPNNTALPTPTSTPSPVATAETLRVLKASDGPEEDVSAYRLRAWTEPDSVQMIASMENLREWDEGQINNLLYADYVAAFERERLLKFPDSPKRMDAIWDIILSRPAESAVPGMAGQQDVMAFYLHSVLARTTLPELVSELKKDKTYQLSLLDSLPLQNLAGNEENGLVLLVQIPSTYHGGLTAVYVIFADEDDFKVERARDWQASNAPAMGRYFELFDVGDTNGNRLPEFVVSVQTGWSGIPGRQKQDIEHFEWSSQAGKLVSNTFPVFDQADDRCDWEPCGRWEFSKEGTKGILTIQSFFPVAPGCPERVTQRVWVWNGSEYVARQPVELPPAADTSPECRLAWAEAVSMSDPRAVAIFQEVLANWPLEADDLFSPASRDFLTLRLGIWQDMQGNNSEAKKLLEQVAKKPANPAYGFAPSLATEYLQHRPKTGKVGACAYVQNRIDDEYVLLLLADADDSLSYDSVETPDTESIWGFVYQSICNVYEVLPAELARSNATTPNALRAWLNGAGIRVYEEQTIDMNSDGQEDRLILMDTDGAESVDAWAFLGLQAGGYQAIWIEGFWPENTPPVMKFRTVRVGQNSILTLIQVETELVLFDASNNDRSVYEADVQSYEVRDGTFPAKVLITRDVDQDPNVVTYVWMPGVNRFLKEETGLFDSFEMAQAEIERLLYGKQDYARTIAYIETFLKENPQEPLRVAYCEEDMEDLADEKCYEPPWYLPYFRYLRAIAYEQLGQTQDAVNAYYELWDDYLDNVFGMAAHLKLEKVNP